MVIQLQPFADKETYTVKINTMFISIGFHIRGQGMGWDWDGIDYDPAAVVSEHALWPPKATLGPLLQPGHFTHNLHVGMLGILAACEPIKDGDSHPKMGRKQRKPHMSCDMRYVTLWHNHQAQLGLIVSSK